MLFRNTRSKITDLSGVLTFLVVVSILFLRKVKSMISTPKIVVITGANKGIGYEIAKQFNKPGYKTILACRNDSLGKACAIELNGQSPSKLSNKRTDKEASCENNDDHFEYRQLDISSHESISAFVSKFKEDYDHWDILINNAAIAFKSADPTPFHAQAEPTVRTNYHGTVDLTLQMIAMLNENTNRSLPRIVNVASMAGHLRILPSSNMELKTRLLSSTLSFEDLDEIMNSFVEDTSSRQNSEKWPTTCYGMSKLGVIAFTKILAKAYANKLIVNAVCPGWCSTSMSSFSGPRPASKGAETPTWLALSDEITTSGSFYQDLKEIQW